MKRNNYFLEHGGKQMKKYNLQEYSFAWMQKIQENLQREFLMPSNKEFMQILFLGN